MLNEIEQFFDGCEEPLRGTMLYVHRVFTEDFGLETAWKYGAPFYVFHGKNIAYQWHQRKNDAYYLGFYHGALLSHPALQTDGRKQVKVLPINAKTDLDVKVLQEVIAEALMLVDPQFEKP